MTDRDVYLNTDPTRSDNVHIIPHLTGYDSLTGIEIWLMRVPNCLYLRKTCTSTIIKKQTAFKSHTGLRGRAQFQLNAF